MKSNSEESLERLYSAHDRAISDSDMESIDSAISINSQMRGKTASGVSVYLGNLILAKSAWDYLKKNRQTSKTERSTPSLKDEINTSAPQDISTLSIDKKRGVNKKRGLYRMRRRKQSKQTKGKPCLIEDSSSEYLIYRKHRKDKNARGRRWAVKRERASSGRSGSTMYFRCELCGRIHHYKRVQFAVDRNVTRIISLEDGHQLNPLPAKRQMNRSTTNSALLKASSINQDKPDHSLDDDRNDDAEEDERDPIRFCPACRELIMNGVYPDPRLMRRN